MLAGLFVLEDIDVLDEQHVDAAYQGKAWHTMQAKLGHSVFKHICSQAVATASQRFAEEFSISRIKEFMKGFEPEIAAFWAEKRATYADEPEEIEVYDEPEDIEPGTPQPQLVEHGGHDHLYIPMVGESRPSHYQYIFR
jgi:hypothetical protein